MSSVAWVFIQLAEQTDPSNVPNQPPGSEIWSELEPDDQDWALDDAAEELTAARSPSDEAPPPSYEAAQAEQPVQQVVDNFVATHLSEAQQTDGTLRRIPLPCPVIVPQRRPKQKARGFIRAYAPVLQDSGIDQRTFIDFVDALDKAATASPVFTAINVAAAGAGMVPEPIAQGVSAAVQVTVGVASEIQKRHRSNEFLAQMNRQLFMPRGLFCMVMTFKPSSSEQFVDVGLKTDTEGLITKQLSAPSNKGKGIMRKLQVSTGKTKGEFALPDCAGLVFPKLDRAAAAVVEGGPDAITEKQKSRMARSGAFLQDYMDRRARASYSFKNPDSKLTVKEDHKWASRYSDPNHPANSGHLVSLLTGGLINPRPLGQGGVLLGFVWQPALKKINEKMKERSGENVSRIEPVEDRDDNPYGAYGRERREGVRKSQKGLIGRILSEDVLYLMVCNLPEGTMSPSEAEAAV